MAAKKQESKLRHPEAAAKLSPVAGGAEADELPGGQDLEMAALIAAAEAEFGRSLPRMKAELRGGGVPDLDALETALRESMLECLAKTYSAMLEAFDAELPLPPCPTCGELMERHSRAWKTILSRFGPVPICRIYLSACKNDPPARRFFWGWAGGGRGLFGAGRSRFFLGGAQRGGRRHPMFREACLPEHRVNINFFRRSGGRRFRGRPARRSAYDLFLNRQLSLPVSMISQWCVSRSRRAVVIFASMNTLGHSPNARFVAATTDVRS